MHKTNKDTGANVTRTHARVVCASVCRMFDKMAVPLATYGNGGGFVHHHNVFVHVHDGDRVTSDGYLVSETGSTMPDTLVP